MPVPARQEGHLADISFVRSFSINKLGVRTRIAKRMIGIAHCRGPRLVKLCTVLQPESLAQRVTSLRAKPPFTYYAMLFEPRRTAEGASLVDSPGGDRGPPDRPAASAARPRGAHGRRGGKIRLPQAESATHASAHMSSKTLSYSCHKNYNVHIVRFEQSSRCCVGDNGQGIALAMKRVGFARQVR